MPVSTLVVHTYGAKMTGHFILVGYVSLTMSVYGCECVCMREGKQ